MAVEHFCLWHLTDITGRADDVGWSGDIVAKVFLQGGTQILRPVDAAIE
jgi:hypothetical protein